MEWVVPWSGVLFGCFSMFKSEERTKHGSQVHVDSDQLQLIAERWQVFFERL